MISPTCSSIRPVRVSGAAVHPFVSSRTSAIRSVVLLEGPEFRKLPSGHALVKTELSVWWVVNVVGMRSPSFG
jgi:hypothetical protein